MNPKPSLILVDDEERILRSLGMLFRGQYDVRMTTDARQALAWVETLPPDVIVSDQRMPLMTGAELLREVRQRAPDTMRLLLTGYAEIDAVVASVNEGEIFRFVQKPWDAQNLRDTVAQAARIAQSLRQAAPRDRSAAMPARPAGTGIAGAADRGPSVLVIEDDAAVVHGVQEILGPGVPVHWARSIDEAMPLIDTHPVGVIVSELRVGGHSMGAFLKLLKAEHPDIVTVVLTPFQDVSVFIGLINQGQVYRLLPKPVRRGPLGMSLNSALRHHQALRQAPTLHAAHAVEPIRDTEESGVAGRLMGMLSRLRGRTAPLAR